LQQEKEGAPHIRNYRKRKEEETAASARRRERKKGTNLFQRGGLSFVPALRRESNLRRIALREGRKRGAFLPRATKKGEGGKEKERESKQLGEGKEEIFFALDPAEREGEEHMPPKIRTTRGKREHSDPAVSIARKKGGEKEGRRQTVRKR